MSKKIVYLDMDGVIADFNASLSRESQGVWNPPEMMHKGFFRNLPVVAGAKEALQFLLNHPKLDVYIASKPTTKNFHSATEKFEWLHEHFPQLVEKVFLICDKSHLAGDYLIDDDLKRWGAVFKGKFLHFNEYKPMLSWLDIVDYFKSTYGEL